MNKLKSDKQRQILHCLLEGCGVRSTARLVGCSKTTVLKLLVSAGQVCLAYQQEHLVNLPCKVIQVDELWSIVKSKKFTKAGKRVHTDDTWTYTAICPDTKVVPCWLVGSRSRVCTVRFMQDLASRLTHRIQLTTDGYTPYKEAVEDVFGSDIDYAMLVKDFVKDKEPSIRKTTVVGEPKAKLISTSIVERQNLTMRTNIKRFARKTNAISKKLENHGHAVALYFFYYNFIRIHQSLGVTPAMAAGVSSTLLCIDDIINIISNCTTTKVRALDNTSKL